MGKKLLSGAGEKCVVYEDGKREVILDPQLNVNVR